MTNQLKDWISYRQLNVMDETYVINCCKEDACFVSTNFQRDLENWRSQRVDYILPDFVNLMRGEVRPIGKTLSSGPSVDTQKLALAVERFALPELLFHPSDVEINQMGIVEAIQTVLKRLPKEMQFLMVQNIVLTGGNSLFPGYRERIELDLRPLIDDIFQEINIILPKNPIAHPWDCAKEVLNNNQPDTWKFAEKFVTRAEYEEHGVSICRKRFSNYWLEGEEFIATHRPR